MAAKTKSPALKTAPRVDAERAQQALLSRGVSSIRGLSPETLVGHLDNFDLGYLRGAALLWQKIKDRCDTTKCVAEKRELDAALLNWEILPSDDSPAAAAHKAALEDFYNGAVATHALDQNQRGGVSTLIKQMMQAVGHKYAVHEIVWSPAGSALTAVFHFTPLQFFENTTGRLRFLATDHAYPGEELEEGGWMVTVGPGLMEATSIAYLFKSLPLKAWLIFCDKFGLPGLHGETTAAYGSEEWNRFRDALASYAQDWALLTSAGGKITPLEANASGVAPHSGLVDRMDRAISRIWRGADLGTMSQQGSATGSNPQQSENEILAAADAAVVSETLNHYVDRFVIRYRFGVEPKAYFKLQPQIARNLELEIKIDEALIKWGVPRAKKDLLETYGRPEPDAGDELATAPAVPAPGGFGVPSPAAFGNEAAGNQVAFLARSVAQATAAEQTVMRPLLTRLAAIEAITDQAAQLAALAQLRSDWPALAAEALRRVPTLATVLERVQGTAFASGVVEAAAARPTAPAPSVSTP